jgi:hypothetical protein
VLGLANNEFLFVEFPPNIIIIEPVFICRKCKSTVDALFCAGGMTKTH